MSMLSAQCDELRSMAESVGLAVPQAATLMMEAADTIERLREQTEDMDFQLDKWQTKAVYFKQLADLVDSENAKLRELVKDFFDVPCQCLKCEHYNYEEDRCDLRDRACELGVKVD